MNLQSELETDVVVLGGGVAGLTAALLLAGRGKRVALLARDAGGGETADISAQITLALDAGYHYLRRRYSMDEAKLAARALQAAIDTIAELTVRHSIDCQFRRLPGYAYTEKRKYVSALKNEASAAREAGLEAQWTDEVPLPFATRGAVLWPDQAQLEPRAYLAGLATAARAAGVQILAAADVAGVKGGDPCVVETSNGRIRARHVIDTGDAAHANTTAARIYTIVTPVDREPVEAIFWDTADQQHATWFENGALVVRGEEDAEDAAGGESRLEAYLRELYGDVQPATRASSIIRKTEDGLPICTFDGKVFTATGFGRREATLGTLAALVAADAVTGAVNEWAALLDPRRFDRQQASAPSDRESPAAATGS